MATRRQCLLHSISAANERTWCVMSGRACAISRPILARTPWWSSQLSKEYFSSPPLPFLPPAELELEVVCLYVSRHACSSTTMSLRVFSFSWNVLGVFGATGIIDGSSVEDAGRLRGEAFAEPDSRRLEAEAGRTMSSPALSASPPASDCVLAAGMLGDIHQGCCVTTEVKRRLSIPYAPTFIHGGSISPAAANSACLELTRTGASSVFAARGSSRRCQGASKPRHWLARVETVIHKLVPQASGRRRAL